MIPQRAFTAIPWILFVVLGCGHSAIDRPPPPKAPQTIETDGQTWIRVEPIEDRHQHLLARHFARNPSLAENPIFTGELALYRGKDGSRRFYWLSWLESDVAWLYLEFDGRGRFVGMCEGSGSPF